MKKKVWLISALFMGILLVSCGGQPEKNTTSQMEKQESTKEEKKEEATELQTGNISVSSIEELNELVAQEMDARAAALNEKYEKLQTEIDTYDKYVANQEKIADYYDSVYEDMEAACICMEEYCVKYAQTILASDKTNEEKYDDLEEMYDAVYDEAGEEIYDEFYDGVLDDIYDVYYAGILDDAYDIAEYENWIDIRSEAYELWLDTRSETYELWLDFRSDVYEFWLDLRGEFWDDDLEKVQEKIQDFQNDIVELKADDGEKIPEQPEDNLEAEIKEDIPETDTNEENSEESTDGVRSEFKEAMDSYETFYDKYCEFMEKYNANPTDTELISSYSAMMTEAVEVTEKFEAWKEKDLNTEELKYYIEVNNRVAQKLVEVADN